MISDICSAANTVTMMVVSNGGGLCITFDCHGIRYYRALPGARSIAIVHVRCIRS